MVETMVITMDEKTVRTLVAMMVETMVERMVGTVAM